MIEQFSVLARQEQHARELRAEAEREQLAGQQAALPGWECKLCLRLGRWLVAFGQRLELKALGTLSPQLGGRSVSVR